MIHSSDHALCDPLADSSTPLQQPLLPLSVSRSKPSVLNKLKAERDPDKLFHFFKANATNRHVILNRITFDDTVSCLAGACRFYYVDHLLEHQKTLPQAHYEDFVVHIVTLYGKAGMTKHVINIFNHIRRTVKFFSHVRFPPNHKVDILHLIFNHLNNLVAVDKTTLTRGANFHVANNQVISAWQRPNIVWILDFDLLLYSESLENASLICEEALEKTTLF
ncbi:hypothetical protein RJT34_16162 [Clitoria ternatea]|uniref:Uncharacterized protein n=1 Tax=Clitoria ternatea TaxID=43366 RepID=A0AAN9PDF4_CLITE